MRRASFIAAASLLLLGAGCLASEPVIPSVERIPFPTATEPIDTNAGPQPEIPVAAEEPAYTSGVRGTVLLGDQPYAAELRIATKGGTPVKRFRSGEDGKFVVSLLPGTYVVGQPTGAPSVPSAQDQEFTVTDNAWTDVTVRFTGSVK